MTKETVTLIAVADIEYEHPGSREYTIRELTHHRPSFRGASTIEGRYSGTVTEFGEAPPDAWNAAIEAAVKACEEEVYAEHMTLSPTIDAYNNAVRDCAEAIRRLKR